MGKLSGETVTHSCKSLLMGHSGGTFWWDILMDANLGAGSPVPDSAWEWFSPTSMNLWILALPRFPGGGHLMDGNWSTYVESGSDRNATKYGRWDGGALKISGWGDPAAPEFLCWGPQRPDSSPKTWIFNSSLDPSETLSPFLYRFWLHYFFNLKFFQFHLEIDWHPHPLCV